MLKKGLKILLLSIVILFHHQVYAATDDSTLVRNRYTDVYAVYDGIDRIHLYEAERYTFNGVTAYCIEIGAHLTSSTYSSTEESTLFN